MRTKIHKTALNGLHVVEIDYFQDTRGFFIESWHKQDFKTAGITTEFVVDGHSKSTKHVLRGIHYQKQPHAMTKLVRCTRGKIFDVVIDLRVNSKTFGKWLGFVLSSEDMKQLYIPEGFAHGHITLSDISEVQYKLSTPHHPQSQVTIAWNDPDLKIVWPIKKPILSKKDQNGISFREYKQNPAF